MDHNNLIQINDTNTPILNIYMKIYYYNPQILLTQ